MTDVAAAHRETSPRGARDGRLAVVMITRNRRSETLRALEQHMRLPERPHVILVDNGSDDGTADAVADAYPAVEVARAGRNLGAAARNIGLQRARTPYVAFSDDDSWWEPGALARAAEILDGHPSVGLVTGRSLVGDEAADDPLNEELARSPLPVDPSLPGPRVMGFLAHAAVVRSRAFLDAGGFDDRMRVGGEEELLACDLVAAGWNVVYVEALTAHHHPSRKRSPEERRRIQLRNALWFLWLRRPLQSALLGTLRLLRAAPGDRVSALAVADAVRGIPSILRDRRVVPARVEQQLKLLDAA